LKKTSYKRLLLLCCTVALTLILAGCQKTEAKDYEAEQTGSLAINLDKLLVYKDSYIGDNSAVGNILFTLPGNIYAKNFYLETAAVPFAIEVDYGIKSNSDLKKEDLIKYWTEEMTQKIFLNNAAAFFILVKNVDEVRFNLDTPEKRTFSISRQEMEQFFGKDLRLYAQDKQLWTKEVLEQCINNNEKREKFFEKYKLTP